MRRSLPKPATSAPPRPGPLLWLWPERFLFIGPLSRVALHRHAATVCLVSLEGELRVRLSAERRWWRGGSALIPAGCTHELDLGNHATAVLYNDPHRPYYRLLSARERAPPVFGLPRENSLRIALSGVYAAAAAGAESRALLETELARALDAYPRPPELDVRVRRVLERIQQDLAQNQPLSQLARAVTLSPGRLQHLFLSETGVPLRRFRTWIRFRQALEQIAGGASFTQAALAAGFASSTHFSHACKAMFGVSAASVLAAKPGIRILQLR